MSNIGYADADEMAAWARSRMQRTPDFVIGEPAYLKRWWIVPRNEQQNVYLHHGLRDDDDRALHDHPWDNQSLLLIGRYREITPAGTFIREPGSLITRRATDAHRHSTHLCDHNSSPIRAPPSICGGGGVMGLRTIALCVLLVGLSGCADRRTLKQRAYDDCVTRGANPIDCASGATSIYGEKP